MTARYIIGDVFDALESLPDNSVDLVFSSPPFLALRSYLPADHPLKDKEIGSEATPADFLDTLLDVVEACDRVLAPHGSLCFELGDTFAGSGGAGGDYAEDGLREGQPKTSGTATRSGWHRDKGEYRREVRSAASAAGELEGAYRDPAGYPLPKSLCGIPTLFAWSLAYGRNLLRPERTTPRWRIRNVVVWARPNPPVGALGDKFRPATSYLTVACKSDKRWFDLDAVREPYSELTMKVKGEAWANGERGFKTGPKAASGETGRPMAESRATHAGAPPLDYWEIPTQPYPGSHYATFPDKLVVKPVKAMCPSKVCRVCGEPSRRIVEEISPRVVSENNAGKDREQGRESGGPFVKSHTVTQAERDTTGWTDCGCGGCSGAFVHPADGLRSPCDVDHWRNGVTLDVFAGSGTTLAVATGHGRDAIGIDIDARNAELALERVGPLFLTVETLEDTKPFVPPAEDVRTDVV